MKCILCGKRRGKRFCPAKNAYICPQCCGQKRVVEILCPSDCGYLSTGQSYQSAKKYVSQLHQEEDPVRRKKLHQSNLKHEALLRELEGAILRYAEGLRSLRDEHISKAVDLLKDTYRTEKRGVIYEHTSPNPLTQALVRDLRDFLEGKRSNRESKVAALPTEDILECLEVLDSDIRYHLSSPSSRESYLRFIARNHPESVSGERGDSLIQL